MKSWATKSLGKLKNVKNIEPLVKLLHDNDPKIRLAAVKAFAELGDRKALNPLISALGDDDWDIRKEIENALNQIDKDWMKNL